MISFPSNSDSSFDSGLDLLVQQAMEGLRRAAASKQIEPLCSSYQGLRAAAGGGKVRALFERIDGALGPDGRGLIVSSFARRKCFMCKSGMNDCDSCKGTGLDKPDHTCPHCDGFGVSVCEFCGGTDWADRQTVPPELLAAVLGQQAFNMRAELARLGKELPNMTQANFRQLPAAQRRHLAIWLMRLFARLGDLRSIPKLMDAPGKARFAAAGELVRTVLKHLIVANRLAPQSTVNL